jgi:hypothetical protein
MAHAAHVLLAYAFQPSDLPLVLYVVYRWLKDSTPEL